MVPADSQNDGARSPGVLAARRRPPHPETREFSRAAAFTTFRIAAALRQSVRRQGPHLPRMPCRSAGFPVISGSRISPRTRHRPAAHSPTLSPFKPDALSTLCESCAESHSLAYVACGSCRPDQDRAPVRQEHSAVMETTPAPLEENGEAKDIARQSLRNANRNPTITHERE
jgi:hypothetical protein